MSDDTDQQSARSVKFSKIKAMVSNLWILMGCVSFFLVSYAVSLQAGRSPLVAFLLSALGIGISVVPGFIHYTSFGRKFWATVEMTDTAATAAFLAALVAGSLEGFTCLSCALYQLGVGRVDGPRLSGTGLARQSYESFVWHLADAVPVLSVPETLNWKLYHPFTDHGQGSVLLAFEVVVIVPGVYLILAAAKKWWQAIADNDTKIASFDSSDGPSERKDQ
jgi:hypothetical protein